MPTGSGALIGRRIVVTGAATGIGRAAAERVSEAGGSIALLDISVDRVQQAAADIRDQGGRAFGISVDVADEASVGAAIAESAERLEGIDGLVIAAGVANFGAVGDMSFGEWEHVIRVNLTGAFLTLRSALPHLVSSGSSAIVTIGSLAAVVATPSGSSAAYKASKGGLLQLTKSVAVDYADDGVRANCVCPGAVRSELIAHSREVMPDMVVRPKRAGGAVTAPIPRVAEPSEVAGVIAFLLSDEASFMTGGTVMVDGGYTAI